MIEHRSLSYRCLMGKEGRSCNMAKFCGKCGSRLDVNTGLCPHCDREKPETAQGFQEVFAAGKDHSLPTDGKRSSSINNEKKPCPFCFRVIKIISHRIVQSINSCISCDKICSGSLPSFSSASAAFWVGAKCKLAVSPMACLLNSSG